MAYRTGVPDTDIDSTGEWMRSFRSVFQELQMSVRLAPPPVECDPDWVTKVENYMNKTKPEQLQAALRVAAFDLKKDQTFQWLDAFEHWQDSNHLDAMWTLLFYCSDKTPADFCPLTRDALGVAVMAYLSSLPFYHWDRKWQQRTEGKGKQTATDNTGSADPNTIKEMLDSMPLMRAAIQDLQGELKRWATWWPLVQELDPDLDSQLARHIRGKVASLLQNMDAMFHHLYKSHPDVTLTVQDCTDLDSATMASLLGLEPEPAPAPGQEQEQEQVQEHGHEHEPKHA